MTRTEQTHIDAAYANVKCAMDELAQVLDKDKFPLCIGSRYAQDPAQESVCADLHAAQARHREDRPGKRRA